MWPSWSWVTPLGEMPALLCHGLPLGMSGIWGGAAPEVLLAGRHYCSQQCKVSKMQAHWRRSCQDQHIILLHWLLKSTGGQVCCTADCQPHCC